MLSYTRPNGLPGTEWLECFDNIGEWLERQPLNPQFDLIVRNTTRGHERLQYGDGKSGAIQEKDLPDGEEEKESQRSEIPRHHRSREAHSRHNRRAERGRYRSVLAVGVGCAVAGGWICLATVVYVVRYLRAKKDAATRDSPDDLL
ncbi:hypothetical protein pdam_00002709 [Pocillopora damicornis]|uniref:Uncharacterized protein n=1 Tax=Pocillopora damicornis TaxID=46731 RepID=A0A3M6TTA5_POCDA|nr:hypothetical protein pdam_00002709 [Pocillopora damicornis]